MTDKLEGVSIEERRRIRNKGIRRGVSSLTNEELPIFRIMEDNVKKGVPNYGKAIKKGRGGTFKGTF